MILVLVVGCGIGWKVSRDRSERQAVEAIRAAGGMVLYDYQFSTDPEVMRRIMRVQEPAAPRWLRRWLGEDFFQTVMAVRISQAIKPEVLDSVARLNGLVDLNLTLSEGLDDAWPVLGRMTRLEQVFLGGPGVNEKTMQALGTLRSLRRINLSQVRLTDKALDELARQPTVRELAFFGCRELTDDQVARFLANGPPHLEYFTLLGNDHPVPLTVAALAKYHPGLRRLGLISTPVADADLAPLGALTGLTELSLQRSPVTDAGIAYLTPLRNLEQLWISLPGVTDESLKLIGQMRTLRKLDLSTSNVSDAGLARLGTLTSLEELILFKTKATSEGVIELRVALPRTKILTNLSLTPSLPTPTPTPPR